MKSPLDVSAGGHQHRPTFAQTLQTLLTQEQAIASLEVATLSDLSRDQMDEFRTVWQRQSPARRRELISALVEYAEDHVQANFAPIYRWLIEDDDPHIRVQTIEGLWEEEDVRLISPLIRRLQNDEVLDVRAAAALSLGRFLLLGEFDQIDQTAAQRVENALLDAYYLPDQDAWVRRRVLEALANSSNEQLSDMILDAYEEEEELMRIGALFAMGRSADTRWNNIVLDELGGSDNAMVYEAVRASGELEIEEAVPDLIRFINHEDVEIRDAAVWALGRIGGREAKRVLKACCASEDEDLSEAAEDALAELDFLAGDAKGSGLLLPSQT